MEVHAMNQELFSKGDVVEFVPERDRFRVNVNGRFDGKLTVEEVVNIPYQEARHRNVFHSQDLVLRNPAGQIVMGVSDPTRPAIANGWYFRKASPSVWDEPDPLNEVPDRAMHSAFKGA
jgi:hypothetical protein